MRAIVHVCARLGILAGLVAALAIPAVARGEPTRFVLDEEHLSIAFLVHHVGFAKTLGLFRKASGSFTFDETIPTVRDISVTIEAASVFTNHPARDAHLRKKDFLWTDRFQNITFRGTTSTPSGPTTGTVTGDLTLRGVTRPVVLDVVWNKSGAYPFGDGHRAIGVSARTMLKRTDFGMNYAAANGWVGDLVEIIIEFEARLVP